MIFIFNLIFYSQRFLSTHILTDETNFTYCADKEGLHFEIFLWIDLVNSTLIPFSLMFICSVSLIFSIFKSRRRLMLNGSSASTKRIIKRDINFSITLVVLNLTFIALNLPIHVYFLIDATSDFWFFMFIDLYYSCYAINFFIYFTFNSIFRKEFMRTFTNLISSKYFNITNTTNV